MYTNIWSEKQAANERARLNPMLEGKPAAEGKNQLRHTCLYICTHAHTHIHAHTHTLDIEN